MPISPHELGDSLRVLPCRYPRKDHPMLRALTVRTVETIKPGPARREIPDRHLPGLYLIVQPSGARSWAVRYRSGGRSRKHTLGSYPALDLKAARTLAGKALRAVAAGRHPAPDHA